MDSKITKGRYDIKMKKEGYAALLLLCTVCGLSLASVWHLYCPYSAALWQTAALSIGGFPARFGGTLFSLLLVFWLGFSCLRHVPLMAAAILRSFSTTALCYVGFSLLDGLHLAVFALISALKLLLFIAFCRLALLFGDGRRDHPARFRRYCLQYAGDFLFICGISSLLCILPYGI